MVARRSEYCVEDMVFQLSKFWWLVCVLLCRSEVEVEYEGEYNLGMKINNNIIIRYSWLGFLALLPSCQNQYEREANV